MERKEKERIFLDGGLKYKLWQGWSFTSARSGAWL